MAAPDKVHGRVVDAHSHIGTMQAWKYYDLKEPVNPTVYDFPRAKDYLSHLDGLGVERGLVLPNYGVPIQEHAFSLHPLILDSVANDDRLVGGLWVSILPQNKERTLETLQHAGEAGIVALKTTFLLGGNPDPNTWDDDTRELAEACFDAAERHDLVFHFHTSAGGNSDINNFIPLVEKYGKRIKIYLVHFGGGVSGHIKLVPRFLDWVEQGYRVYCDTTWTIGVRRPLAAHRDREARRGGGSRALRLRRAVERFLERVLEDQGRSGGGRAEGAHPLPQLRGAPRRSAPLTAVLSPPRRRSARGCCPGGPRCRSTA